MVVLSGLSIHRPRSLWNVAVDTDIPFSDSLSLLIVLNGLMRKYCVFVVFCH